MVGCDRNPTQNWLQYKGGSWAPTFQGAQAACDSGCAKVQMLTHCHQNLVSFSISLPSVFFRADSIFPRALLSWWRGVSPLIAMAEEMGMKLNERALVPLLELVPFKGDVLHWIGEDESRAYPKRHVGHSTAGNMD